METEKRGTADKAKTVGLLTGPFFPEPPKVHGEQGRSRSAAPVRSYKDAITHLVLHPVDVDGVYGFDDEELMPLPFDTPKMYNYLIDIVSGIYTVAQATIIMFISILVDNDWRSIQLGSEYSQVWAKVVRAIVCLYPLCTLTFLVILTVEYACRKFMYYRLLSLRILVDWRNIKFYQGWFFYYFMATWALLNVWSLFGVIRFWYYDGSSYGSNTVSFTSWIVVNLQTIQLLLYYMRLLSSEERLVSLNQIFERDPIEAQHLLKFTYVIEEELLIMECRTFGYMTNALLACRMANIFTCGYAYQNWLKTNTRAKFDVARLAKTAGNFNEVEQNVADLRSKITHMPQQGHSANIAVVVQEGEPTGACEERHSGQLPPMPTIPWPLNRIYDAFFDRLYGSIHAFYISTIPSTKCWPYRGDIKCFQLLIIVEIIGICCVSAIVVFGLLRAASSGQCEDGNKVCHTCNTFLTNFAGQGGKCQNNVDWSIAKIE